MTWSDWRVRLVSGRPRNSVELTVTVDRDSSGTAHVLITGDLQKASREVRTRWSEMVAGRSDRMAGSSWKSR